MWKVTEHCEPQLVTKIFVEDERRILETDINEKLHIFPRFEIKTYQYIGIILPNHKIQIIPKIYSISFVNITKYALNLIDLNSEYFSSNGVKVLREEYEIADTSLKGSYLCIREAIKKMFIAAVSC